ncbi:LOW QUALITY PROTEIN: hypothetical protein PanWU01x14_195140 [Parasponia andersonii]|uniref:Transmembrane protein n=1 Tax=Parasponia andersonii TaxID=3476 RepID=A0A2P5C0A6_PARAD|nr:LOW QUALITY PROTEIN: hypothetical protein PanWU01x14_195140 [Parasponia andersonii]
MPKQNSVVVLEASRYSLSRSSTAFSTIYIHLRTKKKKRKKEQEITNNAWYIGFAGFFFFFLF